MPRNNPKEKFEVREIPVYEDPSPSDYLDPEKLAQFQQDQQYETQPEAIQEKSRNKKAAKEPKNKYGWAFFLFCLFMGIGFTATFDVPLPLFVGMGTGFLFFVDPIYEKVMRSIEGL